MKGIEPRLRLGSPRSTIEPHPPPRGFFYQRPPPRATQELCSFDFALNELPLLANCQERVVMGRVLTHTLWRADWPFTLWRPGDAGNLWGMRKHRSSRRSFLKGVSLAAPLALGMPALARGQNASASSASPASARLRARELAADLVIIGGGVGAALRGRLDSRNLTRNIDRRQFTRKLCADKILINLLRSRTIWICATASGSIIGAIIHLLLPPGPIRI